jgi:hypothetical protein
MAALAEAPLRRRALERQGMTEEMELKLLIQEQEADDVFFVSRPPKEVSLDAPFGSKGKTMIRGSVFLSDFVGVTEDGALISFLPRSEESVFLVSFKHCTFDAYNNHGCRCRPCKSFMAEYRRQKRAA